MGLELAAIAQIVSAVAVVGGAVATNVQGNKAAGRQRAQNRRVQASNAAKAATAKRQTLRAERVRRAQLLAQAEAAGVGESSTAISGEALSGTLAGERIGQISSALDTANVLSAGSQSIADARQRQQLFSNVSAIGSSVFSSVGGPAALEGLINK